RPVRIVAQPNVWKKSLMRPVSFAKRAARLPFCRCLLTFRRKEKTRVSSRAVSPCSALDDSPAGLSHQLAAPLRVEEPELPGDRRERAEAQDRPRAAGRVLAPFRSILRSTPRVALGIVRLDLAADEAMEASIEARHRLPDVLVIGLAEAGEDEAIEPRLSEVIGLVIERSLG